MAIRFGDTPGGGGLPHPHSDLPHPHSDHLPVPPQIPPGPPAYWGGHTLSYSHSDQLWGSPWEGDPLFPCQSFPPLSVRGLSVPLGAPMGGTAPSYHPPRGCCWVLGGSRALWGLGLPHTPTGPLPSVPADPGTVPYLGLGEGAGLWCPPSFSERGN